MSPFVLRKDRLLRSGDVGPLTNRCPKQLVLLFDDNLSRLLELQLENVSVIQAISHLKYQHSGISVTSEDQAY